MHVLRTGTNGIVSPLSSAEAAVNPSALLSNLLSNGGIEQGGDEAAALLHPLLHGGAGRIILANRPNQSVIEDHSRRIWTVVPRRYRPNNQLP